MKLRPVFCLLYWEAAFAMAYETWVGPTYLSGLAGEAGMPVIVVSLLTAAPFIGSVGQAAGAWVFERVDSVKGYTLRVAAAARALWALPLFLAVYWQLRPDPFPARAWFGTVALLSCVCAILSTSSAAAWQSWVSGIVPRRFNGRFFGFRQRYVMVAIIVAHLLASLLLEWKPGGARAGYAVVGGLALLSALLSTLLLSRVPAPPAAEPDLAPSAERRSFIEAFREPLRDREFMRVALFGAAFNGVIQMAGPYFPYYFTRDLQIPMSQVAIWMLVATAGCLASSAFWGRRIDRADPARSVLLAAAPICLSPLFYVISDAALLRRIAPLEYFLNGASWAGYLVGMIALLFRVVPRGRNAAYFSLSTAMSGLSGAAGSLLGGALAEALAGYGGFRALWVIAAAARGLCVLALYSLLFSPAPAWNENCNPARG